MGICNLDQNKDLAKALATYLNISIKKNLEGETPFKLVSVMRDVYKIAYEKDQDVNKALGVAGAMPKLFLQLLNKKPEYLMKLADKGFKIDPIIDFNKKIETSEKPLDVVSESIKGIAVPTVTQAIQNSTSVEPISKPIIKEAANVPTYTDKSLVKDTFKATTGFSVVKSKEGKFEIDQANPAKAASYAALQNLLMIQTEDPTFENVKYDGHTGFKLKAAIEASLPANSIYSEVKTSTSVVLAITDNQGNYLYFDDAGKISNPENGKVAYFSLEAITKEKIAKKVELGLEKYKVDFAEKSGENAQSLEDALEQEEKRLTKKFNQQAKLIESIRLKTNMNEKVMLDITGGEVGFVDDRAGKNNLSEFNLKPEEIRSIGAAFTDYKEGNRNVRVPAVKFANYDKLIGLKGLSIKIASPELFDSLINLLVDDLVKDDGSPVSPQEKIDLFKQYAHVNKFLLSAGENALNIFIGKELVSLENKEEAKKVILDFLAKNAYHTFIKTLDGSYTSFNIADGVLSVKQEPSYVDFISKYLVPRVGMDINTKRPMINNGYFTFEVSNQQEVAAEKAKEAVKEAKEEIKKSKYNTDDLADALERSKLIASRSTPEQEAAGDKWLAETALLKVEIDGKPVITLADLRNIVNSDAFATFAKATMTLHEGGNSTHMYHEAWHAFSQIFLKKGERDHLYTEAAKLNQSFTYIKKVPGPGGNTIKKVSVKLNTLDPKNPSDRKILEEFIAEEFRVFAMNKGAFKTTPTGFKAIFKKIWALLKALFKGTVPIDVYSTPGSSVFSEMFNALYNAKNVEDLNMFQPAIQNAEFGTLNTGLINELSELDMELISRSIDGIISNVTTDLIINKGKPGAAMQIFATTKALDFLYNVSIKTALSDRLEELVAEKKANESKWNTIELDYHLNNINILQKALDNFGDVKSILENKTKDNSITAYHLKNSAFASRIKEAIVDPTDISETSAADILARNDKQANSAESEKLATASAVYIMQSLVQQEYNDNKTRITDRLNQLGFPQTIEFKPFWNFLMNKVGGEQNEVDLYNKLVELKDKKVTPLIQQLLDKVGDPAERMTASKISADIWLGLVRSMNMTRIDLHNNVFEVTKDEEGEVVTALSGNVSGDYHNIKNNVWKNKFNLETGPFVILNEDKQNELNLEAIGKTFLTSPNNYKQGYIDGNLILRYRVKEGADPIAFLNSIGLYMTNDPEVKAAITPDTINYIADAIGQAWFNGLRITDPLAFFNKSHSIKVQKLAGSKLEVVTRTNDGAPYKIEPNASRVNDLALIEADHTTEYGSQMKLLPGSEGNKKSVYSLNSTTTRVISAINHAESIADLDNMTGDYGIVPQYNYVRNPAVMGSIYKNTLFDNTNTKRKDRKLILRELVGAQYQINKGGVEGLSHNEMTATEKFISDLQSMLSSGFIEAVRSGEKSTYYAIRPDKIMTLPNYNKSSDHLFFDTEHFLVDAQGKSITGVRVNDYLLEVMHKKLEGELRRIQKINNGITEAEALSLGLAAEDAKNFYKNHVKGFENGGKFDWFDDILEMKSEAGNNKLKNDLINQYAEALTPENNLRTLMAQTEEGKKLKAAVDAQILSYFKNLANEFKVQNYDKAYGPVLPDYLKALATKNLNSVQKTRVTDEQLIDGLMMSFAVNSALQSDEILLTIFGDGFQFNHSKDEGTKRVPTYNSPGVVFSTGTYSVAAINQFYPRAYEAKLIEEGVVTTRTTARSFDKIGQKAIIKDATVKAQLYDQYHELFRNTLSKRNYTSEQIDQLLYGKGGTITDPASGSVMDTWANIKDADGQGYISFDYYRMLKANENNWTNAQEALYQKELRGEYISAEEIFDAFPVYKLQYAGPLAVKGTVYPIQSIDKFSLLPLIPSLIKGTRLETVHKEMIKQGVDYALFDSGAKRSYIKAGKSNGDVLFENNDSSRLTPDFKFTINPFYVDFLKNQTEVNREFKGQSRLSTQFRKLFDVTLYEAGKPLDYKGTNEEWNALSDSAKENESPIHKKAEAVVKQLARLTSYMRKDLLTELGWEEKNGKLVGDMETMLTYIKGKLEEQGYSKQEIQDIESDDGKFDLSTSPIAPRLERFLFSIVNNRLIRIKIKGEAFVQVSGAFFQKFEKPSEDQKKLYDDFGTNGIRGYVVDPNGKENTKAVRVKIALTENYESLYNTAYFKDGKKTDAPVGVYDKEGNLDHAQSFKRLNEMIKDDAWLEDANNREKIQITGVRIPVQGANSTEFAEVWEFLPPSAGPIIIIPAEIVAKSGGDFDVDKLTMYIKKLSSTGTLLQDTYSNPDVLKAKIKLLQDKLGVMKADKMNIKNQLADFRKSIEEIQGYVEMSKEQIKGFTNKNNKALLETLAVPANQEFLKEVAPKSYQIYNEGIKFFIVDEYDQVDATINKLFAQKSELSTLYKELTDLKEHKRNFTEAIQNTLIDNIVKVLQSPEMAFSLLLPNGTYLTKPYADELQEIIREVDNEVDYTKSINTGEKLSDRAKGVSPSALRNYNYNLKKQQDNVTGKNILGPIVLEIPVNNQFNKAGTILQPSIEETITVNKQPEKVNTPLTLELVHNTVNGNQISMSSILDADKKNQIADVLSQLANGAVDVGKDAWIAYLQGNLEAIPKILFLLETGVPIAEVAYFMNNPLIREYVSLKQKAGSKIAKLFFGSKHSRSKMVKDFINAQLGEVKKLNTNAASNMDTLWGKHTLLKSFLDSTKVKAFDKETLRTVAKGKGTLDQQMAGFLEYLYVEQLTSYHDELKGAIDVDNNVTGDNAEVQAKLEEISSAKDLPIYNPETFDYLKNKSVLSPFFIQELTADLFGERFFSFRADTNLDKYIRNIQNNFKLMGALKKNTGITKDSFAPKFKNALTLHIFTNALAKIDLKSNNYKGKLVADILKGSPVESIDQAIEDFETKRFLNRDKSDQGYRQRGLYPISELSLAGYTKEDFVKLTLEREYLRKYILPFNELLKESIEFQSAKKQFEKDLGTSAANIAPEQLDKYVYESMLLHQALLNTYNNYEMFSSGNHTVAKKLIDIINNYPDLKYNYGALLDRFTLDALTTADTTNPRRNFKLKANSDISKAEAEHYHTLWQELANPSKHKLSGVTPKDLAANKYISDFFTQLPVFAFLQSGMDMGKFSMNSIMPTDAFKPIIDQATQKFKEDIFSSENKTKDVLDRVFYMFLANNNVALSKMKGRGLSYKKNLYEEPTIKNLAKVSSEETIAQIEANTAAAVALIARSVESETPAITKPKLINDVDLASYKTYVEKSKGIAPKKFFTSSSKFKAFYNEQTGRRDSAPQTSMWLLNQKGLYDLVDQTTGEMYLENVSLETGYQEIATEKLVEAPVTLSTYTNYSGAAQGADTVWENIGKEFGVGKQVNYVAATYDRLSTEQKKEVEEAYVKAVAELGRRVMNLNDPDPKKAYGAKLTRRDYLQAKAADSIFAIVEGFDTVNGKAVPKGGTGYAVVMGAALGKPVHIFSQETNKWYNYNNGNLVETDTPVLTPKYAGIGTRKINDTGKQAIRDVYTKSTQVSPMVTQKKNAAITSIQDAVKNYRFDEVLAEKGYDVQDIISNLEAATTIEEVNNIINKLLKDIC